MSELWICMRNDQTGQERRFTVDNRNSGSDMKKLKEASRLKSLGWRTTGTISTMVSEKEKKAK